MTDEHARTPPSDRFCDLVMKGGIASGIVYPLAIEELARDYLFHSIGGTSAGAIAAAVTAAAEFQRRDTGSQAGFKRLAELPAELGSAEPDGGPSRLLRLFQPQPRTRRLYRVLIAALNKRSTGARIAAVITGFLRAYWPATVAGLVRAVNSSNPHATDLHALIRRAGEQTAAGYPEPLTADQVEALTQLLRVLVDDMAALTAMDGDNPFVPVPRPELRVRPPL